MMIGLIPALIIYGCLCAWIVYTYIIADVKTSPMARFFKEFIPGRIMMISKRLLGDETAEWLSSLTEYTLVFVYLIVVLGSWSVMFTYGYEFIAKSKHVSSLHKHSGYVVFMLCMWSWKTAHKSNPGYITAASIPKFDNYPYDDLLFTNRDCPTLGIRKLPRSKFDRASKCHVARFDHFCGWVNNTVGEENYRIFLRFLVIHVGMCFYGTIITWNLFKGEVEDKDLFNAIFFNGMSGEEVRADLWIVSNYLFMKHFELAAVFILMAAMTFTLGSFLGFHLYIAANGMTTNEYYKWKQVKKWHKREKARYEKAMKEGKIKPSTSVTTETDSNHANVNISDGDVGCVGPINETKVPEDSKTENEESQEMPIMDPGPFPKNIYNKGVVENFKEILFPRSLRKDAIQRWRQSLSKSKGSNATKRTNAETKKTKAI